MRRRYIWLAVPIGMTIAGCALLSSGATPATSTPVAPPQATPTVVVSGAATSPTPSPSQVKKQATVVPASLEIPYLHVNAPLDPIDVNKANYLAPPNNPTRVGWWKKGVGLGSSVGTVVLTGHTVHTGGGALNDAGMLRNGDIIIVTGANGKKYLYRVTGKAIYAETNVPSQKVYRQDGPPQLSLQTCDIDSYNWTTHTYSKSTVVYAVPIS